MSIKVDEVKTPITTEEVPTDQELTFKEGELGERKIKLFTPKCTCDKESVKTGLKWTGVALVVIGVAAGVIGLLVCLGVLQIGLTNVMMSLETGLYLAIAGFGIALITAVLLVVARGLKYAADYAERGNRHVEIEDSTHVEKKSGLKKEKVDKEPGPDFLRKDKTTEGDGEPDDAATESSSHNQHDSQKGNALHSDTTSESTDNEGGPDLKVTTLSSTHMGSSATKTNPFNDK